MTVLAKDKDYQIVQAFMLPVTGKTIAIPANTPTSLPSQGLYRFVATTTGAIALGSVVAATDMDLLANIPESFGVPANSMVTATVAVKATLM